MTGTSIKDSTGRGCIITGKLSSGLEIPKTSTNGDLQNLKLNGNVTLISLPFPDSQLDVVELSLIMELPHSMNARLEIMVKPISTLRLVGLCVVWLR
jgi:hypothetical protein